MSGSCFSAVILLKVVRHCWKNTHVVYRAVKADADRGVGHGISATLSSFQSKINLYKVIKLRID